MTVTTAERVQHGKNLRAMIPGNERLSKRERRDAVIAALEQFDTPDLTEKYPSQHSIGVATQGLHIAARRAVYSLWRAAVDQVSYDNATWFSENNPALIAATHKLLAAINAVDTSKGHPTQLRIPVEQKQEIEALAKEVIVLNQDATTIAKFYDRDEKTGLHWAGSLIAKTFLDYIATHLSTPAPWEMKKPAINFPGYGFNRNMWDNLLKKEYCQRFTKAYVNRVQPEPFDIIEALAWSND
jgi:hypothetical protein